jgi:hypothetical protein
MLNAPTLESLLRYRRLQWFWQMMASTSTHVAVLSALFRPFYGSCPATVSQDGFPLSNAPAWVTQLFNDLVFLAEHDDRFPDPRIHPRGLRVYLDRAAVFWQLKLKRCKLLTCRASWNQHGAWTDMDVVQPVMTCPVCCSQFDNLVALRCHARIAHDDCDSRVRCVVTNQCPLCEKVFQTHEGAKAHVRRSTNLGRCRAYDTFKFCAFLRLVDVAPVTCPECELVCDTLEEYNVHVRSRSCSLRAPWHWQ